MAERQVLKAWITGLNVTVLLTYAFCDHEMSWMAIFYIIGIFVLFCFIFCFILFIYFIFFVFCLFFMKTIQWFNAQNFMWFWCVFLFLVKHTNITIFIGNFFWTPKNKNDPLAQSYWDCKWIGKKGFRSTKTKSLDFQRGKLRARL